MGRLGGLAVQHVFGPVGRLLRRLGGLAVQHVFGPMVERAGQVLDSVWERVVLPVLKLPWRFVVMPVLCLVWRVLCTVFSCVSSVWLRVWLWLVAPKGVRVGEYIVGVPEGRLVQRGGGTPRVLLQDQTAYTLQLFNASQRSCNALVMIDGKEMGTWRLHPWQRYRFERPAHAQQRFVFVAESAEDAADGGVENGMLRVVFTPCLRVVRKEGRGRRRGRQQQRRGVTVLGDAVDQEFHDAVAMEEDHDNAVHCHVQFLLDG